MGFPIVNVQPRPSTASQIAGGLSQGLDKLLEQHRETKQRKSQLKGLAPLFEELGFDSEATDKLIESGIPIESAVQLYGHAQKAHAKKKEEGVANEDLLGSFRRLWGLSDEIGYSPLPPQFSPKSGLRSEFDTTKSDFVTMLRNRIGKGVISNQKLDLIVNKWLPASTDSTEVKKGKLRGLARTLGQEGVDISALQEIIGSESPEETGDRFRPKHAAAKAAKAPVRMRDPETGAIRNVPADKVDHFKSQGAQVVR